MPLFDEEMLILRPSAKRMRSWHVGAIQPRNWLGNRSCYIRSAAICGQ